LGARLAIGKPTRVTCLSGGGAQGSTDAESSEWKQKLAKNTAILCIIIILYNLAMPIEMQRQSAQRQDTWAAQGFKASSVRNTRIQSKRIVRGHKLARAVPAPRPAAAHKGASEASSDYSE
jgi:hypothetical protein